MGTGRAAEKSSSEAKQKTSGDGNNSKKLLAPKLKPVTNGFGTIRLTPEPPANPFGSMTSMDKYADQTPRPGRSDSTNPPNGSAATPTAAMRPDSAASQSTAVDVLTPMRKSFRSKKSGKDDSLFERARLVATPMRTSSYAYHTFVDNGDRKLTPPHATTSPSAANASAAITAERKAPSTPEAAAPEHKVITTPPPRPRTSTLVSDSDALSVQQKPQFNTAEIEEHAKKLIQDIDDQTRPWEMRSAAMATLISLFAAASIASTTDYFANRFLNGKLFEAFFATRPTFKAFLRWTTTVTAATTTGLLSFNTNFTKWNQIFRTLSHLDRQELKRNIVPLVITGLSALVSQKLALDAFRDSPTLGRVFAAGRTISALGTNGTFATSLWAKLLGYEDRPILALIFTVDEIVKKEIKERPEPFIQVLAKSKLFYRLAAFNIRPAMPDEKTLSSDHAAEKINEIIESLLMIYMHYSQGKRLSHTQASKLTPQELLVTGACLFTALSYFTTGLSVPLAVFHAEGAAWTYSLGSALGTASTLANTAIGAVSTLETLSNRLPGIAQNFSCKKPKDCSRSDIASGAESTLKLLCATGYGLAQAGNSLEYPFLESDICGWFQFGVGLALSTALGDFSIHGFLLNAENGYHLRVKNLSGRALQLKEPQQKTLDGKTKEPEQKTSDQKTGDKNPVDAQMLEHSAKAPDLSTFYNQLGTDKEKEMLRRFLRDYLVTGAFKALRDFFNYTPQHLIDALLNDKNKEALNAISPSPQLSLNSEASASSQPDANRNPLLPRPSQDNTYSVARSPGIFSPPEPFSSADAAAVTPSKNQNAQLRRRTPTREGTNPV